VVLSAKSPNEAARPARIPGGKGAKKDFCPRGSAQFLEKARFEQENPRKSKPFPLIFFDYLWLGLAGF
jgi:hypothetical protein